MTGNDRVATSSRSIVRRIRFMRAVRDMCKIQSGSRTTSIIMDRIACLIGGVSTELQAEVDHLLMYDCGDDRV